MLRKIFVGVCACVAIMLCAMPLAASSSADTAGAVHTVGFGSSTFDQYTNSPSLTSQEWLRSHLWRMGVFSPYFDSKTSWYKNGWLYKDSYAIYTEEEVANEHPEWVLHGASGEKLYIPWGCSSGTCPQYAGNIANAGFRSWWIEAAKASLAHGYRGLFIDDVNMEFRVSNGNEQQVAPIDPATGQPMTYEAWRRYMAQFMTQIRAALPGVEIVHNAIWFADSPARQADTYIQQEESSADYIYLERGVNDSGLTGGSGEWSLNSFLSYAEHINALGKGVVLGNSATNQQGTAYDLASYFLISDGNDGISIGNATPQNWWPGWETQLGVALGSRYTWDGLQRRDFTSGLVLVNGPGAATQTVHLDAPMYNTEGELVSSVTLPATSGAILRSTTPAISPVSASDPEDASTPESPATSGDTTTSRPGGSSSSESTSLSSNSLTSTALSDPSSSKSTSSSPGSSKPTSGRKRTPGATPHHTRTIIKRSRIDRSSNLVARSTSARARAVSASSSSAGAAAGQAWIDGTVVNATAGSVVIHVQILRDHSWTTTQRALVGVSSHGAFVSSVALAPGQRYRVCATYRGAHGYSPSRSGYRLLELKAR
jgi:hypothetical protein